MTTSIESDGDADAAYERREVQEDVMYGARAVRASEAERAAISGTCAHCREPFSGRRDKRFCSDKCRTAFGRVETARQQEVERHRVEHAVDVLRAALDDVR